MFETFLIQPIYNGLIFLIGVMPAGDVGLAIIAATLIVRAAFYPAFTAFIRTQMGMQAIQGELDEINEKYKDNPAERTKKTMALFKEHNVRPLAGFLALVVQLPVFIGLYIAFFREGLPDIQHELLYSFIAAPTAVSTNFFGILDLTMAHNIVLAVLVAITQYIAVRLTFIRMDNGVSTPPSPERAASQRIQRHMMAYVLPGMMAVFSYLFPSAVGLYFLAGNVVSIGQELWIKRQIGGRSAYL